MFLSTYFKSPFTDLTGCIISHQWFGRCTKIEMKFVDCMEAYGYHKGFERCADLMEDLRECSTNQKQGRRIYRMRYERHRQYYTGERSKQDRYAEPPRYYSY